MIKVLFVDHTPFAGGAQLVLAEHIAQIDKTRYEVHVACTNTVPLLLERYQQAGATVHLLALPLLRRPSLSMVGGAIRAIMQLRFLMRRLKIDLVISNTTRASYFCSAAVLWTCTPLIWWVRDFLYPKIIKTPFSVKSDFKNVRIFSALNQ